MREVGISLVTVEVAALKTAIRAELVREILGRRGWIQVPGSRDEVPGIVVWGGRAVAVVDFARFHPGLSPLGADEARPRLLIVQAGRFTLGIPADRVSEVWKASDEAVRPRQLHDFTLARSEIVVSDEALPLFEPEVLFSRLELEA